MDENQHCYCFSNTGADALINMYVLNLVVVEEVHYRIWPAEDILSSNWGEWNAQWIDFSAVIQKD